MITYGFYNSKNHDRKYNANQLSSIFDGIIHDGVYMDIGDRFMVTASSGMTVMVGTGRAWFDHTWTFNDSILPLEISKSEVLLDRIDAIVLETNSDINVRANTIKIIKGEPDASPLIPEFKHTETINQYPLATIIVHAGAMSLSQADITNYVGTSKTPFVTGVIQTMSIDDLISQWWDQWHKFYEAQTKEMKDASKELKNQWDSWYSSQTKLAKEQWNSFYESKTSEINDVSKQWSDFYNSKTSEIQETYDYWKSRWEKWFYEYINTCTDDYSSWKNNIDMDFRNWWDSIKDMLDGNPEANFAEKIIEIENRLTKIEQFMSDLENEHTIYDTLLDTISENITDNNGDEIKCKKTVFTTL